MDEGGSDEVEELEVDELEVDELEVEELGVAVDVVLIELLELLSPPPAGRIYTTVNAEREYQVH